MRITQVCMRFKREPTAQWSHASALHSASNFPWQRTDPAVIRRMAWNTVKEFFLCYLEIVSFYIIAQYSVLKKKIHFSTNERKTRGTFDWLYFVWINLCFWIRWNWSQIHSLTNKILALANWLIMEKYLNKNEKFNGLLIVQKQNTVP